LTSNPAAHDPRLLVLLRHGEAVWNRERRFTTRTDSPLTELGMAQAREAARALADAGIARVACSPLQRARITGEVVAQAQIAGPAPVSLDERLVEIDAGPFEGLTPEEIEAGPLAGAYARWRADCDQAAPTAPRATRRRWPGRVRSSTAHARFPASRSRPPTDRSRG
jgi:broad specificity phosphatase PhoE